MENVKILLVEDESIEALDIKRTLESFGYLVPYIASRGKEAVKKAEEIKPDLILMDIILKGNTDGIEAVSKIKKLNIPVIYLTAHSEESTIERAKLTEPYGYIIKPYDATELKYIIELAIYKSQMEKELKESEMKYKTLFEGAGVGIGYYDVDGKIISYNNLAAAQMNSSPEKLEGKTLNELFDPESASKYNKRLKKTIEIGQTIIYEDHVHLPSDTKWFQSTYNRVENSEGDIIGVQVISHDITELKRSQKALINSEGLLRGLFDNMPSGMAVYHVKNDGSKGSDYIIKEFNHTSQEIEGMKREEVVGKSLYDIRPNINEYGLIPIFKKVWETGEPIHYPSKIYVDEKYANWYENYVFKAPTGEIVAIYNDVTEQEKANEALKESEEKHRRIVETANEGIWSMDADFKTIFVNNKMADLLGYSSDEMVGKVVMDFMFEEDLDKHWERMQKRVKGFPGEYEHRFKCKNGDEIWLSVSASALKDENGEFFGSFAMFTDITERKKAEGALKESEERYRDIFENAVEGIFQSTPDGNYLSLNPAFAHMYGYGSPDEMIREVSDIQKQLYANHEDREKIKELLNADGVIKNFEVEFNRKDGKKLWASINATALKDKYGKIYYEGTTQDITERKKAEKALKESEEFLDNVVENIPNMIFIKSADDLSFKLINKAAERLLGHSREELMGKTDHDFFPKNEADFFTQKDREVLKNKTLLDIPEETIETKKLGQRILHTKKIPLVDSDNNPQYLLGISEDITELKKAENSLKDSEEMLRDVIFGSPIPTFVIDKNHKVIYWNHALEKQSGIQARLIVGTAHHWKAFYDKKRPCMADLLLNGLEDDISKWYPKKFKQSKLVEGAYEATDFFPNLGEKGKWLHFTASVVKDAQGDVVSAVETLEDITQQKVAEKSLKKSFKRFSALAESAVDGIVTTSINGTIKFFNESFLNIFGYKKNELLNKPITMLMPKRKRNIFLDTLEKFKKTSEHRLSGRITETIGLRKDGTEFPFEMSLAIWKSGDNKYFTSIIRDITDRKKAENILKESIKEKEILLREIHHRVKNNLQIIASLLHLQEGSVNDDMVGVLMESEGRVKTMAMVHEKLYQSPSFTDINFKEYVQRLVHDLYSSYAINTHDIRISLDIEDINLNIDTSIPLGLIINELITNSIKHAFKEGNGQIKIILRSKWNEYELIVSDNGKGIPKDLDFRTTSSLGLQLVNSLVSQIDGEITLDRIDGTKFQITFKELEYPERI